MARSRAGGAERLILAHSATDSAVSAEKVSVHPLRNPSAFWACLPYPPSVNHLWRRVGNKTLLSAEGRRYREEIGLRVRYALKDHHQAVPPPPHRVTVIATVPDRRRRDIDNLLKGLLDPIYAALGLDDSVITHLEIEKRPRDDEGPRVDVTIVTAVPDERRQGGG